MKSIEVTLRLLKTLAESEDGVSVLDIARKISFSKSSTHRALQVLEREKYAVQDPTTNRYKCGPALFNIAFNFLTNFNLRQLARPILRNIVDGVNENVYLCVYIDKTLYFIEKVESNHPIRYVNPMGKRQFLHAAAPGKVIMAHLPAEQIEEMIARGLPRYTPNTITDPEQLLRELKTIKKQGYAFSSGEFATGGNAIAVPLLNPGGHAIGCINMVIPEERYDRDRLEHYVSLLNQGTEALQNLIQQYGVQLDLLGE
jgi:DNA-binding IclR family transcriptional regulator